MLYEENTDLKVLLKDTRAENKAFEKALADLKVSCMYVWASMKLHA